MERQDILTLSQKAREDGRRLFGVCELIYKASIVMIWIIGIIGVVASIPFMQHNIFISFGVIAFTIAMCFIFYMGAVLSTHVAKVMVHTAFANVGVLEHISQLNFKE